MGGNKCVDLIPQKKPVHFNFGQEENHRLEKCQLVGVYILVPSKATRQKKNCSGKSESSSKTVGKISEIIDFGDDRGVFSNFSISSWKRKIAQGFLVAQF